MRAQLPKSDLWAWFLVGPTASGKSAAAQYLAEQDGSAILSADAMLVYRGMDVGTAKPTAAERAQVRYYGLDLVDLSAPFSAAEYRLAALRAFRDARTRSCPMIVAGGSGLYIKSLTDGLAPRAPGQTAIRQEADRRMAQEGLGALKAWLVRIDPARYASLDDPENPRRLIRALESALAGDAPAVRRWRSAQDSPRIPGLKWSLPQLYDRIQARVRGMFAGGLLEEVERLLRSGLEQAPTAGHAIGYREAASYLRGRCSLAEAMSRTVVRSRQLAKRQMTWFRHQCNVEWLAVDAAMTVADIAGVVREYWKKQGPTPVSNAE